MFSISNWVVGAVVGIILALILVLILQNTAFKNMNMKILYIIIFVIMAVAGGLLQSNYFTAHAESIDPKEVVEELDTTIKDNWKNTNGGFTFEQITKAQDDNECPFYDDQIINLKCYDFGSYIVFAYQDNGVWNNTLFYKSDNGLILDGMINTYASLEGIKWFLAYDLDNFKWVQELNKEPYYWTYHTVFDWHKIDGNHDDLVSCSRQSQFFVKWTHAIRTNQDEMIRFVSKNAASLAGKNATDRFIKFGDVELIGTANTGLVKINSFYNYLYEQVKGESYNTVKLIDGSSCLCLPIPEAQRTQYPISASKKAEYDNADYYGVYRCNIAVNLTYVQGNETISSTTKNEDYIDKLENDQSTKNKVEVEVVQPKYSYAKLGINFVDSRNSDLSNINLFASPIKITFSCSDTTQTKTITIDSFDKLNQGVDVLLAKNQTWDYFIDSGELIFENFRGSFTIRNNASHLSFNYYYLDNFTVASVGLNPIGTIDTSQIDLFENPVKIILSNANHTYQFVFSDNSELDDYKSTLVEMGEYNYTILSKQLIFASVTGKLTITTTDKIMLFNYALGTDEPLTFNIHLEKYSTTNNQFYLYSLPENVDKVRNHLSSSKVYLVTCVIYDNDGRLMETFEHTHLSTGTCCDTWYASNLVAGQTYTLQLRFTDKNDTTVTYLSDITTFTFQNNYGYKVVYDVTENN